jgi:hypothetical protein
MRKTPDKKSGTQRKIVVRDELPTAFADNLMIVTRSDGMCMLQFCSTFPDQLWREEARIMVPSEGLKAMVDVVCRQLDYYPKKSKGKKKGG